MRYSIRTVTPAGEIAPVIALAEAKAHLRVDHCDDDALIAACVLAAQDHIERLTAQILSPREMEYSCAGFPAGAIEIPRDPITEVTALAYLDASGVAAELGDGEWRWSEHAPDRVLAAFGARWPAAATEAGSVRVTFTAGYEEGLAPASLIAAVKLLTGTFYGNRESVVTGVTVAELPGGVDFLIAPYRRVSI